MRNSDALTGVATSNPLPRIGPSRRTRAFGGFETIVACTIEFYRILSAIGFCLIRQSSAGPIAIPRRTKIGSVNAHNSVRYFNRPVDRSLTNLAIQFRLGIYPSGGLGLILLILLILALVGQI